MSIIYEALKKTQKKRHTMMSPVAEHAEVISESKFSPVIEKMDAMILLAVIGLLMLISLQLLHKTNQAKAVASLAVIPKPTVPATANLNLTLFKQNHVLNGTFISKAESFALIDNKPFHLGDHIDGLKIVSLKLNSVKLQSNDQEITLKT